MYLNWCELCESVLSVTIVIYSPFIIDTIKQVTTSFEIKRGNPYQHRELTYESSSYSTNNDTGPEKSLKKPSSQVIKKILCT